MTHARKNANNLSDGKEIAIAYDEKVKSHFEPIRYHVDKLEMIVNDEEWPLPKFRELLFIK
jgi:glutamine synthetase